jgi:CheY-specific phosphatase CheX
MNKNAQAVDVRQYIIQHLGNVFQTMLARDSSPVAGEGMPFDTERVTGCVGLGGENVSGVLYLHLSAEFAHKAAVAMLGLDPGDAIEESEVNDVVGELTNMLTGGLKSTFCDAGIPCMVSTPTIIRGTAFNVESAEEVERIWQMFESGGERVVVETHIKFS